MAVPLTTPVKASSPSAVLRLPLAVYAKRAVKAAGAEAGTAASAVGVGARRTVAVASLQGCLADVRRPRGS